MEWVGWERGPTPDLHPSRVSHSGVPVSDKRNGSGTTANRLAIPWYRHDRRRQKLLGCRKNDLESRSIVSEGLIWRIPD